MTDGVNDDFSLRRFVENHIGVRQGYHAPDGWIIRAGADAGIKQQKLDDRLNTGLNAPRALW